MERKVYEQMASSTAGIGGSPPAADILDGLIERVVKPPKDARILEIGRRHRPQPRHAVALRRGRGERARSRRARARQRAARPAGRRSRAARPVDVSGRLATTWSRCSTCSSMSPDDKGSLAAIYERLEARRRAAADRARSTLGCGARTTSPTTITAATASRRSASWREDAGYEIELLSPFNSLLFPPIAAVRFVGKLTGKDDSDDAMPSAPVNKALERSSAWSASLSAGCRCRSGCRWSPFFVDRADRNAVEQDRSFAAQTGSPAGDPFARDRPHVDQPQIVERFARKIVQRRHGPPSLRGGSPDRERSATDRAGTSRPRG